MISLIDVRTACVLINWYIMNKAAASFSRIKARIKIFIMTAIIYYFLVTGSPKEKVFKTWKVDFTMLTVVVTSLACNIKTFPPLYSPKFQWNGCDNAYFCFTYETNDIINSGVNKDLVADSIINIVRECVVFGLKTVFISSLTVNSRRNLAFIIVGNKTLKARCLMHNFYFIDNSNIKKDHIWKDGLNLNRPGKNFLTSNFLRDINNFLRNLKYQDFVT